MQSALPLLEIALAEDAKELIMAHGQTLQRMKQHLSYLFFWDDCGYYTFIYIYIHIDIQFLDVCEIFMMIHPIKETSRSDQDAGGHGVQCSISV